MGTKKKRRNYSEEEDEAIVAFVNRGMEDGLSIKNALKKMIDTKKSDRTLQSIYEHWREKSEPMIIEGKFEVGDNLYEAVKEHHGAYKTKSGRRVPKDKRRKVQPSDAIKIAMYLFEFEGSISPTSMSFWENCLQEKPIDIDGADAAVCVSLYRNRVKNKINTLSISDEVKNFLENPTKKKASKSKRKQEDVCSNEEPDCNMTQHSSMALPASNKRRAAAYREVNESPEHVGCSTEQRLNEVESNTVSVNGKGATSSRIVVSKDEQSGKLDALKQQQETKTEDSSSKVASVNDPVPNKENITLVGSGEPQHPKRDEYELETYQGIFNEFIQKADGDKQMQGIMMLADFIFKTAVGSGNPASRIIAINAIKQLKMMQEKKNR